jgi:glycosyltransferase involved in cell wall biosynthesis
MRIKIIEGMALGEGIVSTEVGAEGIDVTPGKNIIIANGVEQFCNGIAELLNDRKLLDKIGSNAIDFVNDKFDNLEAANELIEFYKQNIS